ncbi:MAG: GWxTD domain-containing protein [Gemmatimonadetes bacterium]|nr:GWxTD domain-containing protein [Gemmatimonadota bacterium]
MKTFLIALCLFLVVVSAYGATVLLEDGTVLKGELVSESEDEVVLKTAMGELRIKKSLIKMIEQPSRNVTVLLEDGTVLKGELVSESETEVVIKSLLGELRVAQVHIKILEREDKAEEEDQEVAGAELQASFGEFEDQVAGLILGEVASADTAAFYKALDRKNKGLFLARFWQRRNPLMLKYYYGYHFGRRYVTVSDAYFERGGLIPNKYITRAQAPDEKLVTDAARICDRMLILHPNDVVAMCALGYLRLEQDEVKEAEELFLKAIKKQRKFVEARNGRALAALKMPGQKSRSLRLFRETCAMDKAYTAAHYNLGMCHLAMVGMDRVDLDHYFGNVVELFPDHYDAYFKLGVFYESLRYYDKAMKAYSRQIAVNPGHPITPARLAYVAMRLKSAGKKTYSLDELVEMAQTKPKEYLPLLAEMHVERGDFVQAQAAFERYFQFLDPTEREYYQDLSLVASAEVLSKIRGAFGRSLTQLREVFWLEQDPTPTTQVNERRVEHYRRVHFARSNFVEGLEEWHGRGWDRRGDVYIRLGHPDHQSWSDYLVFETDEKVAKVKNRLNMMAANALEEVSPSKHIHGQSRSSYGFGVGPETSELRGVPTFPIPRRRSVMLDGSELGYKWESWIYAEVGGGIEITFLDPTGSGFFDFAPIPPNSPNHALWSRMAPETVVAQVVSQSPSVYVHDYGGDPLDLYMYTANFRESERETAMETYMGVPMAALTPSGNSQVMLDRDVVVYDRSLRPVFRDSVRVAEAISGQAEKGTLMVDQVRAALSPGQYFLAAQVRDPISRKVQVHKTYVAVSSFRGEALALSDLELAGQIVEVGEQAGKFQKGDLRVVPLPSKIFAKAQPVYLYYEVYNLNRDAFGQTRYRVEYRLKGVQGTGLIRGLGRLLSQTPQTDGVQISYEHTGTAISEPLYIALDVPENSKEQLEIEVVVTDLNRPNTPSVSKQAQFLLGD